MNAMQSAKYFARFASLVVLVLVMVLLPFQHANSEQPKNSELSVRAVMIHPRTIHEMDFYSNLIKIAAENGFNTVILEATGWINYKTLPSLNLPNAFSDKDMTNLVSYAKSMGLEVIPSVALLTHQQEVIKRYAPELLLNEVTADISKPATWEFEKKIMDENIEIFHPKMMLVGHDELWGYKNSEDVTKSIAAGVRRISPAEYASHIVKVHDYLSEKGVQTIIWGDMFVMPVLGANGQVDRAYPLTGSHGTPEFASLIGSLPRDIVIADWHYDNGITQYPSFDLFQKLGFRVWGATWDGAHNIRSYSAYVIARARKGDGMIATTWHYCMRKYQYYVTKIIIESGKAFTHDQ